MVTDTMRVYQGNIRLGCGISNSVVVPDLAGQSKSRASDVPSTDLNNGMRAITCTNSVNENFDYC